METESIETKLQFYVGRGQVVKMGTKVSILSVGRGWVLLPGVGFCWQGLGCEDGD